MTPSALRFAIGIPVLLLVLLGVVIAIGWWKISQLKQKLIGDLEAKLGAQVQVGSLTLDPWKGELQAAGITLTNQRSSAPWQKGDISQATLHFHFSDLFSPTMPVTVEVSSWDVVLHSPLRAAETPPRTEPSADSAGSSGSSVESPGRVKVTQITAQTGTVEFDFSDDRKVVLQGVAFDASDNGAGIWNTELQATSVTSGSLEAGASAVKIRGEPDKVTFSDLHLQVADGAITGEGEITLDGAHDSKFDLKSVDVPVTMLVSVNWQMKLAGLATGDLHYQGSDQSASATGKIALTHGKFNVLPWLGKITAMAGLADFSNVEVDQATSDFAWRDGAVQLTNLDIRKNDVTRISGEVDLGADNNVVGALKLGLPTSVVAKWPQIQTQVFPTTVEDYSYADVHLTGTPDHLQEDLSPRLIAAGLGQGSDLMNSAAQKAGDLLNSLLGK
jgi:hypothetical protein